MADTTGPKRGKNSFMRSIDELEIEPNFNLRPMPTDEAIEEMLLSIIANGITSNLKVYNKTGTKKYTIVEGHTRTYAVRKGLKEKRLPADFLIPTESVAAKSDLELNYTQLVSNGGTPFPPIALAKGYARAISYGQTVQDIHNRLGVSVTHINQCLSLLDASLSLQAEIEQGNVSSTLVATRLKNQSSKAIEKDIAEARERTGKKKITERHLPAITKVKQTDLTKEVSKFDEFRTWIASYGENVMRASLVLKEFNTIFKN